MKKLLTLLLLLAPSVLAQNPTSGGPIPQATYTTLPAGTAGVSGATILNANSLIASGLVADYRFLTGSGTSVVDSSSAGNNATFCSGTQAPGWIGSTSPGIVFSSVSGTTNTECVKLPTALTSTLTAAGGSTIQMLFYFEANDPRQGSANYFQTNYCILCSNGNGATSHAAGIALIQTTGNNTANDTAYYTNGIATGVSTSAGVWADVESTWQGTGVLTYVSNPSGADSIYINGKKMGLGVVSGFPCFACQGPYAGNFFIGQPTTGWAFTVQAPAMNFYRFAAYNRQLSAQEIMQNSQTMNYFAGQTSVIPTLPCCMGPLSPDGIAMGVAFATTIDAQDQIVLFTDSIYTSVANNWLSKIVLNGGPWSLINAGQSGQGLVNFNASSPYSEDPLFRPFGGKNALFLSFSNDLISLSAASTFQEYQVAGARALAVGWTPFMGTAVARSTGGFDATRTTFNNLLRQSCTSTNTIFCPVLIDTAADLQLGVTGFCPNATYCTDGTHPTATWLYNNASIIIGRQINRWYGNRTWSTANTYTASGTNTIATTAASETGNLATITVAAVGPCVAGAEVFVAGMTPTGYNTPAAQSGWYIQSATATTITFYDFNIGLGAQTVAGTIHCAQQVDADDHLILGGAAAGPVFYLESCIGQTQPTYLQITNTNASPWVLTPWLAAQTINGVTTWSAPVGSVVNFVLVELDPVFSGTGTAGCIWQAHVDHIIPTSFNKNGSGAGNYTAANTTYANVDGTNLCQALTIPSGWKLLITAGGSVTTSTAIATASVSIADIGTTCGGVGVTPLKEIQVNPTVAGTAGAESFALTSIITGDGSAHAVAMQAKTANGADSWLILNSSASLSPSMMLTLFPSN